MRSPDGFGTGDPRFLISRKQPPKADIVFPSVASDEVSIGDGDNGTDFGVGVWFHFMEMPPLWRLLHTHTSEQQGIQPN